MPPDTSFAPGSAAHAFLRISPSCATMLCCRASSSAKVWSATASAFKPTGLHHHHARTQFDAGEMGQASGWMGTERTRRRLCGGAPVLRGRTAQRQRHGLQRLSAQGSDVASGKSNPCGSAQANAACWRCAHHNVAHQRARYAPVHRPAARPKSRAPMRRTAADGRGRSHRRTGARSARQGRSLRA